MHLARQLVQKGLLSQDEQHGSLRLTTLSYQALKNREPVFAVMREPEATGSKSTRSAAALIGAQYDRDLFEILRGKRKELADDAGVPPYVIFSDRTLVEMAAYFPQSMGSLSKMYGVGTVKLERYGDIFLELICAYCTHKGFTEKPKENGRAAAASAPEEKATLRKPRHVEVGEAFNEGASLQELVERYGVQTGTILDHLTKFALEGRSLLGKQDFLALSRLSQDLQDEALIAIAEEGPDLLRPLFDRLNGLVSYEELKILRLHYLKKSA
jgi:ATP-dependent DNA helicase RecQ